MAARVTAAQARAMGIDPKQRKRTTRKQVPAAEAAYHTRCCACGEEFHTQAAEDRHVAGDHTRYELVLDSHAEVP